MGGGQLELTMEGRLVEMPLPLGEKRLLMEGNYRIWGRGKKDPHSLEITYP
jgi:hypothetical protein